MAQAPRFMSGLGNFFGNGNQGDQGGGGGQQQEPQFEDDGNQQHNGEFQNENQEPDLGNLIGDMFTPPDPNPDDEEETPTGPQLGPDGKPLPTEAQKMVSQIQEAIGKMSITDDMMPKDFDPSNPQHLRDLLAKSNQQTAATAIQLAFKPMQLAMEEQMTKMSERLESAIQNFGNGQQESSVLKDLVPEVDDPKYSGLVQTLFKQSKGSKGAAGNPKIAAQMVRNALNAMGIKATKPVDPFSGSGFKTGADALNAYAPLPTRPTPKAKTS